MKTRLSIILAALLFSLASWAKVPTVPESELVPDTRHERAAKIIFQVIKTYAYKKKALNDELSSQIFDKYLKNLDANRNFFTRRDVDGFELYRYQLDDDLKEQNLEPAYKIFRRYRQRVGERADFALELLNTEFDFNVDEEYMFDRREAPWAEDTAELNEIWRQRVKNDYLNLMLSDKEKDEIKDTLTKRYTRIKTSTFQLNANDIFQTFINAYTTVIEPHTAYLSPRTSENFDISMSLSLEGIGAVLRAENDYTTVQKIVPGGPADLAGELHAEDRIIGVGQEVDGEIIDVIGWRLDDVVDLIRGPKGTIVRLDLLPDAAGPDAASKIISITRDKIKLEEQAAKTSIIENPDTGSRIGVIDVPTFYSDFAAQARGEKEYKSTTRDVRKLLAELKQDNVDGIIIDLRRNGGGSLTEALEFTGLFIESGPIVQTKDSYGRIDINKDPDPGIAYTGPLAVLVDRNSASASEIFAGAIQDYRRGIIIGEPTFGKGTVQNIVNLNRFVRNNADDHGRLKTTIAQFFRISGGSNQRKGVIPDIIYPTAKHVDEHGERSVDNALPWDEVKPASYKAVSAPIDSFAEARNLHEERIKTDKLFQLSLQRQDIAYESSSKKTVTLLATKRKAERERLEQTSKELQNQYRIAQGLEPLPEDASEDDIAVAEEEEEEVEPVDVLLEEAANILTDLVIPPRTTASNADMLNSAEKIQ